MRRQPAVFLDRDGVINHDHEEYIKSWDEYHFYPGALDALRRLHETGCEVYLVTNQAGVGKGLMSLRHLQDIMLRLRLTVRDHGGMIHGVAFCPHCKEDACGCRKPQAGMLRKLIFKYGLDPAQSVMVGDSYGDIECGRAMGCRTILLHTRPPDAVQEHLQRCSQPPDHECRDLAEAVDLVLSLPQFSKISPVSR